MIATQPPHQIHSPLQHGVAPTMGLVNESKDSTSKIQFIPLIYNHGESQKSALRLILTLRPDWEHTDGKIEFVRFTDGITNTLLKVTNKLPNLSAEEVDNEAILLRAYGKGTDVLIDREREAQNHELLMQFKLAPELLARFQNGMLYRFQHGVVTSSADLRKQSIWRAVANRLAQWHAIVPCLPSKRNPLIVEVSGSGELGIPDSTSSKMDPALQQAIENVAPGKQAPNVWTVMQKWIYALPVASEADKSRQERLQKELNRIIQELSQRSGIGENSLVFAHCDLLSGNVIVRPRPNNIANGHAADETVTFIDFEYATPSPAAFDIANHFAEWGGFECDYEVLPTRSQRRDFIREYIRSYFSFLRVSYDEESEVQRLFEEVDLFRGVPGFYWGIWALIQAQISQINFDYAKYAVVRLGEYWAWRHEVDGSRKSQGEKVPLRERRWAED